MNWKRIVGYGLLGFVSASVILGMFASGTIYPLMAIAGLIIILRAMVVVIYELFKGTKESLKNRRRTK